MSISDWLIGPGKDLMYTTGEVIDMLEKLRDELLQIAREADLNIDKIQERIEELNYDRNHTRTTQEEYDIYTKKIQRKQGVLDLLRRIERI